MCRRVLGIGIGGFKGGCKFETVEIDKRRNEFWTITIARRAWRLFVLREVQHQVSTEAEAVKMDCEDAGGLCAGGIVAGKVVVVQDPNQAKERLSHGRGVPLGAVQCWNGPPLVLSTAVQLERTINRFLHPDRPIVRETVTFDKSVWRGAPPGPPSTHRESVRDKSALKISKPPPAPARPTHIATVAAHEAKLSVEELQQELETARGVYHRLGTIGVIEGSEMAKEVAQHKHNLEQDIAALQRKLRSLGSDTYVAVTTNSRSQASEPEQRGGKSLVENDDELAAKVRELERELTNTRNLLQQASPESSRNLVNPSTAAGQKMDLLADVEQQPSVAVTLDTTRQPPPIPADQISAPEPEQQPVIQLSASQLTLAPAIEIEASTTSVPEASRLESETDGPTPPRSTTPPRSNQRKNLARLKAKAAKRAKAASASQESASTAAQATTNDAKVPSNAPVDKPAADADAPVSGRQAAIAAARRRTRGRAAKTESQPTASKAEPDPKANLRRALSERKKAHKASLQKSDAQASTASVMTL